ncbi:unnamed protein product [Prorocentrum cordatum]|uniref:Subtilisin n=1 Tax=Prorocentrum cordatum TaxID=2364126 RepID=A0ABN9RJN3_9DINO|nr:unnamed protein product [Polarella glacialis]
MAIGADVQIGRYAALSVKPGYYVPASAMNSDDPAAFVWKCFGNHRRCPGGPPGACSSNRANSSLACTECVDGYAPAEDGTCSKCDPTAKFMVPAACSAIVDDASGEPPQPPFFEAMSTSLVPKFEQTAAETAMGA